VANRKDNKGRVLKTGESQRKDGMYEYKYTDAEGKRHSVYSKRLTPSDKYIDGKVDLSLREKITRLQKDLSDGIVPSIINKKTFSDCYEEYLKTKKTLKQRTLLNYQSIYKNCIHEYIGNRYITEIKYGDLMEFYMDLITEGYSLGTLRITQRIVHPVFEMAVRNDYIRKNPSDNILSLLKNSIELHTAKKIALTKPQQKNFMDYVSTSKWFCRYYNLFAVLLGTGCRIGEALGLRQVDCDFNNNAISINHTLGYYSNKNGKCSYQVTTPKTENSIRTIPMLKEVKSALLSELIMRVSDDKDSSCFSVDGYSGFVFTRKTGVPYTPPEIDRVLYEICENYNVAEIAAANRERRDPELLPHITSHILRHTFCTRYCEIESNIKVIQEIMGHANIVTTMQIYNDATEEAKRESMDNFNNRFVLHQL